MTTTIDHGVSPADAAALGLDIRPMAGHIGAEILGVDLAAPISVEVLAAIPSTLLHRQVIFLRDQNLPQERHIAFGRVFGQVTPTHPTLPAMFPDHPDVSQLVNHPF